MVANDIPVALVDGDGLAAPQLSPSLCGPVGKLLCIASGNRLPFSGKSGGKRLDAAEEQGPLFIKSLLPDGLIHRGRAILAKDKVDSGYPFYQGGSIRRGRAILMSNRR